MTEQKSNFPVLAAAALGAIAGLLIGNYLWGGNGDRKPLSKHIDTLSSILEQLKDFGSEEAEDLKTRIKNILTTIESNYGSIKR